MKKKLVSILVLVAGLMLALGAVRAADGDKPAEDKDFLLVRGTISALDSKTSKVTVRQENKKEISASFKADSSTVWIGYEDVDFADLKKGQLVDMECTGPEDKLVINWIEIYETQETAAQS